MSKSTRNWLIAATVLTVVGAMIFTAAIIALDFDFSRLTTQSYQTNTYTIAEDFSKISIDVSTAKITFVPSENESCNIVCFEDEKLSHNVFTDGDTLIIKEQDERKWYDYIGIFSTSPSVTVYLPLHSYGSLFIDTDTGHVTIPKDFVFENVTVSGDTSAVWCYASVPGVVNLETDTGSITVSGAVIGELDIEVSTGRVTLESVVCENSIEIEVTTGKCVLDDVSCESLISEGDTGDIHLTNVTASGSFNIERSTGDVKFEGSDAAEIYVNTSTGDITGTLLTPKIFFTDTSTGKVNVPKSTVGGKCEITTSTGDIKIDIAEK